MADTAEQISTFLQNFQSDSIKPMPKPRYTDTPPVWLDRIILGMTGDASADLRHFTQIKIWIKPPTQHFPKAALMLSMVNSKASCFSKLPTVEDLKTLRTALDLWIPIVEEKLSGLKALESQFELARIAFDSAMRNNNNEGDE